MEQNVSGTERWVSIVGGSALAAFGVANAVARRSWIHGGLAVLGAALVQRGVTGRCAVKHAWSGLEGSGPVRLDRTITVPDKSPAEVYEFWRALENLPRVLGNLESVQVLDERRSHWKARGPAGRSIEWDAEITNDRSGHVIEWRSMPGSDIDIAGTVLFRRKRGNGTKVHVTVQYRTPGGAIGEALARMLGAVPEQEIDAGLAELRGALEKG
jgi:uncharacterized membrane protein